MTTLFEFVEGQLLFAQSVCIPARQNVSLICQTLSSFRFSNPKQSISKPHPLARGMFECPKAHLFSLAIRPKTSVLTRESGLS